MNCKSLILAAVLLPALWSCWRQGGYAQIGGYAQGGTWSVKYNTMGVKARPGEVQAGVESILQDIDRTLSGYNKNSELSRLNAGDTIKPSGMLIRMYNRCHELWVETGGAFDAAAGPLFDIWGFGFRNGSNPSEEQIAAAISVSGMGRLVPRMEDALLPDGRLCASRLLANGSSLETAPAEGLPQLNFNAVAQGYSCDTVASYLSNLGVKDMLVDIGEIICRGEGPSGKPWRIGVDRPSDGNNTPGADIDGIWESAGTAREEDGCGMPFQGIVTSGNYRKFYIVDGIKYAHTIDPRTGKPARNSLLSATIVAPAAWLADAMATYCMVIGLEKAKEYIQGNPQLEGYLIYSSPGDGSMAEWRSDGF